MTRTVGHAGTLDPMATGVLLLLAGEATKLSPYLTFERKRYVARVRFGAETDSFDALGTVVARAAVPPGGFTAKAIEAALAAEAARTAQVPPAVSAIHVNGERAHRLHRRGSAVELAPRPVEVFSLELLDASETAVVVDLTVSKGYYVRAFARDLAEALGTMGHLDALRRVASGPFHLGEAIAWPPTGNAALLSVAEAARRVLPMRVLTEDGARRARSGLPLTPTDFADAALDAENAVAWLTGTGDLVAVGRQVAPGCYRVVRGFRAPDGAAMQTAPSA